MAAAYKVSFSTMLVGMWFLKSVIFFPCPLLCETDLSLVVDSKEEAAMLNFQATAQYVALGPRIKVVISNILPASTQLTSWNFPWR